MDPDLFLVLLVFAFLQVIQTSASLAVLKRIGQLKQVGYSEQPKKPKTVTPEELLKLYYDAHPELKGETVQIGEDKGGEK